MPSGRSVERRLRLLARFGRHGTLLSVCFLAIAVPATQGTGDEVLIYYANGTAPDAVEAANYDVITAWLESSPADGIRTIAADLNRDRRLFPAAVELEQSAILSTAEAARLRIHCVVVTNETARRGEYLILRHGRPGPEVQRLSLPAFDNYIVASNPLSDPRVFLNFLGRVAEFFEPSEHAFILITKSHGSVTHALTPRCVVRHEETSRDQLLALLSGSGGTEPPAWLGRLGIRKDRYLEMLREAGDRFGMTFSVVVAEACDGGLDEHLRARVPGNVRALCVIDTFTAQYINVLYADVIERAAPDDTLAGLILGAVRSKFRVIAPPGALPAREGVRETVGQVTEAWYFAPLAAWFAYAVWRRWLRRHEPRP